MGIDRITTNLMECLRNKGRHGRDGPSSERYEKRICDQTPGLPTPAPVFNPPVTALALPSKHGLEDREVQRDQDPGGIMSLGSLVTTGYDWFAWLIHMHNRHRGCGKTRISAPAPESL